MTDTTTNTTDTTTPATAAPQMTAAEATTKLADLTANHEWSTKLLAGDGPTVREFRELSAAKVQTDRTDAALAGTLNPGTWDIAVDGKLSARNLMTGIDDLRNLNIEDRQIERLLKSEPISASDRAWVEGYEREMLGNKEFTARYLSGDLAARREITLIKLHKLRPVAEK